MTKSSIKTSVVMSVAVTLVINSVLAQAVYVPEANPDSYHPPNHGVLGDIVGLPKLIANEALDQTGRVLGAWTDIASTPSKVAKDAVFEIGHGLPGGAHSRSVSGSVSGSDSFAADLPLLGSVSGSSAGQISGAVVGKRPVYPLPITIIPVHLRHQTSEHSDFIRDHPVVGDILHVPGVIVEQTADQTGRIIGDWVDIAGTPFKISDAILGRPHQTRDV